MNFRDYDEVVQPDPETEDSLLDEIEDGELSEQMSDVEIRLEEACAYKALLKNPLFSNGGDIAQKVEKTVREFIKQQLRILIGLDTPKISYASSSFSKEQEQALKELADRLIHKHKAASGPPEVVPANISLGSSPVTINAAEIVEKPKKRKKTEKNEQFVEKELTFPNGTVKKVRVNVKGGQVKPEAPSTPQMSLQQIADLTAMQAQEQVSRLPDSGFLGLAIHAAKNDLIKPPTPGDE